MSRGGRDLTAEEKKLWRRVATRVKARKPLPQDDEAAADVRTPANAVPKREAKPAAAAPKKQGAAHAPPADRGAEKRVRRGKLELGGTLDLHGHTQDSAHVALGRFLRAAQRRGDRTVVVITGVGRTGEGVLRQRVPQWLAESELRTLVSGFAQAHRAHGGAGAYYVFLKRKPA